MAVTDDAIDRIKDQIVSGRWRPGDRLPPEKHLGEQLGLSRNSLREAVKALEVLGVLDVRRGDGTYVTSLEPGALLEILSFVVDVQQDSSVLDLLEVRSLLEPAAAAMAARRVNDTNVDELRSLVIKAELARSVEELVEHDMLFHRTINRYSGNAYLASVLESLSTATQRARIWRGLTEEGAVARTLAEHTAIVEALDTRDPDLVRAHVLIHVTGVLGWLRRSGSVVVREAARPGSRRSPVVSRP